MNTRLVFRWSLVRGLAAVVCSYAFCRWGGARESALGWRLMPILMVACLLFLYGAVALIRGDRQSLTPREKRLLAGLVVGVIVLGVFGSVLGYVLERRGLPRSNRAALRQARPPAAAEATAGSVGRVS